MNTTYKKMIGFLVEARNPKKPLHPEHAGRLLRRLGKMSASPRLSTKHKSAAARDQLAMHVRKRMVDPEEIDTPADALKGILYQTKIAEPEMESGADKERSRQAREN